MSLWINVGAFAGISRGAPSSPRDRRNGQNPTTRRNRMILRISRMREAPTPAGSSRVPAFPRIFPRSTCGRPS